MCFTLSNRLSRLSAWLISLLLLCPAGSQAQAEATAQQPEPDETAATAIRQTKPWTASFSAGWPKNPGLELSYNLNPEWALGGHFSLFPIFIAQTAGISARHYLNRAPGAVYLEAGVLSAYRTSEPMAANLILNGMIGLEHRDPSGFMISVAGGQNLLVSLEQDPSLRPEFPVLIAPSFTVSIGATF